MSPTFLRTCKCDEVSTVRSKYQQATEIERNAGSEPAKQVATL